MKKSKKTEADSHESEAPPSAIDLIKLFLNEEFGEKVAVHHTNTTLKNGICLISIVERKSVPNDSGTLLSHSIIGGIDGHDVSINAQAPHALQYFTWEDKAHNETRNIADPNFFQWLKESIQHKIMNINHE